MNVVQSKKDERDDRRYELSAFASFSSWSREGKGKGDALWVLQMLRGAAISLMHNTNTVFEITPRLQIHLLIQICLQIQIQIR